MYYYSGQGSVIDTVYRLCFNVTGYVLLRQHHHRSAAKITSTCFLSYSFGCRFLFIYLLFFLKKVFEVCVHVC